MKALSTIPVYLPLLLFVFTLSVYKTKAQSYIKLLNHYSEWHVTTCNSGCLTDSYYTIGDTLINGYHYTFLDLYHYNKNFVIREDTFTRKVYMRLLSQPSTAKEYLLYDFSLQVNDTTTIENPGSPYPLQAGEFILDSIVSKPLITKAHRFFYFHALDTVMANTKTTVWAEGIGSLCLINTPGAPPQINGVGQLSCFFSNGIHEYQNLDSISSCIPIYPVGINEINKNTDISITQNIDNKSVTITTNQNNLPLSVLIYDIEGKLIYSNKEISITPFEIPLHPFHENIMLVKATTTKGESKSLKLINY